MLDSLAVKAALCTEHLTMCYQGQAAFGRRNEQEGIKPTPYCSLPMLLPAVQIEAILTDYA